MTEKAYIHFKEDGKPYLIPELPTEQHNLHLPVEIEKAKDNALPIVNPELLDEFDIFPIPGDGPYEWPGTWEDIYSGNNVSSPFEHKAKLIAPQQTQSDAPNEGREEKTDDELLEEALLHIDELNEQLDGLRDQLSKEREEVRQLREEKENMHNAHCRMLDRRDRDLVKEREMRKELVESLVYISKNLGGLKVAQDEPESIAYHEALKAIKKASELDKNY